MKRSDQVPSRARKRLRELLKDLPAPESAEEALLSVLVSLSDEHAPTAVNDPLQGVDVHIADSLVGLKVPELRDARRIADLGSGCGIPSLVLAACLPDATVLAVDANRKRCEFIQEAAKAAEISNIETVWSRAEEWNDGAGTIDVVIARAVAQLPVILEYAATLLRDGGMVVAWKANLEPAEADAGAFAAEALGLSAPELLPVNPWPKGGRRNLVLSRKISPTPDRFPRRAGIAVKRPLGL
ncbi:MAG: RsmG family class I SAM-dependent methyltransferase [Actinomycetes bacterium]